MGKFADRYNLRQSQEQQVRISDIVNFLYLNGLMSRDTDIRKIDGLKMPLNGEPEFEIIISENENYSPMMMGAAKYKIGIRYDGEEYNETMPISVFNYFCWRVGEHEELKYPDFAAIDKYFKEQEKKKNLAKTLKDIWGPVADDEDEEDDYDDEYGEK